MANLSEHFTLEELTVSQWAARNGVSNVPAEGTQERANLVKLAKFLEEVRKLVGGPITINSGYRGPKVNAAVGGSKTSAHMKGLAADIVRPGMSVKALAQAIAKSGLAFDQVIYEYQSWCHLGLSTGTPRRQVLTKDATHDYTPGIA